MRAVQEVPEEDLEDGGGAVAAGGEDGDGDGVVGDGGILLSGRGRGRGM